MRACRVYGDIHMRHYHLPLIAFLCLLLACAPALPGTYLVLKHHDFSMDDVDDNPGLSRQLSKCANPPAALVEKFRAGKVKRIKCKTKEDPFTSALYLFSECYLAAIAVNDTFATGADSVVMRFSKGSACEFSVNGNFIIQVKEKED